MSRRTPSFLASGLAALCLVSTSSLHAQSIVNPGFETDTFAVFPGYIFDNGPVTGWTELSATQQGINPSGGSPFANNGTIPEGAQVGFIQTNGNTNTFSSTITGLTVGAQYELSFRVNARTGQQVRMNAAVDDEILEWALVNAVGGTEPYGYYVRTFEAAATDLPLSVSSSSAVDQTLLIDDFQVTLKPSSPWSVTAWNNDADSGIDSAATYTHAYNLGGPATAINASINGIAFTGVGGGNPAVAGSFSLVGPNNFIPGDANNVTDVGGSRDIANTFVYNGFPAVLTLEGLTAGQSYRTSIFGVGWDDNTMSNRASTFEAGGERITVDESGFNNNNGVRVDYEFTATGPTEVITVDPLGGNSYHFYGFANAVVDAFWIAADASEFSTFSQGDLVATLEGVNNGVAEATAFSLVAGTGDADNGKFQLAGDQLQIGSHDFNADPNGTTYSVRVGGTGNVSGGMGESILVFIKSSDGDADGLPDAWELAFAADLTVLSGLGGADADSDNVTDLDEFTANPSADLAGLDPTNPDSDGDDLNDGVEVAGPTDPTDADSDDDGLNDGAEIVGNTDPVNKDSDGDGWRDGLEVDSGSAPDNAASVVTFPDGFSIGGVIMDDCSSGLSGLATYTHAISGGGPVTVNSVAFEELSPTLTPLNFLWESGANKSEINPINNNNWVPAQGGVTGTGMLSLLGGFTYSGQGAAPGSTQRFTLSGLTAGTTYDLRTYIRPWGVGGTRLVDLTITNGADVVVTTPVGGAPEDNPVAVLMNGGSDHQAYFTNFRYTAQGTDLIIDANVPVTAAANSGSFHMYGMTNEVASGASAFDFAITDIVYDTAAPSVTLTFNSQPGVTYALDFSTTLTPAGQPGGWQELDDSVISGGATTTVVDSTPAAALDTVFYRIRAQ